MFRANEKSVTIEKRYAKMMHLNQCQKRFLDRSPLDMMAAEAGVALHSDLLVVSSRNGHRGNEKYSMKAVLQSELKSVIKEKVIRPLLRSPHSLERYLQ